MPHHPEREQLIVFPQNSFLLPTKKIGKNNPQAALIQKENEVRDRWNTEAMTAYINGVPAESLHEIKKRELTEPIRESLKDSPNNRGAFCDIVIRAARLLHSVFRRWWRMLPSQRQSAIDDGFHQLCRICKSPKKDRYRNPER